MCKYHGDSPVFVDEDGNEQLCVEAALNAMTPEAKAWIERRPKICPTCGRDLAGVWPWLMIAATYMPPDFFHRAMNMLCECSERALHDERDDGLARAS